MLPRNFKMDEAGSEGASGDGKPPEKIEDKSAQHLELLTKSVSLLAQGLEELRAQNLSIAEKLSSVGKPAEKPPEKTFEQDLEEHADDLEQMDNKQLVAFMVEKLGAKFENRVKELTGQVEEKVGNLAQQFHGKVTSEEVQKMIEKNSDFMEWTPEMKVILREHPNMSIKRAYTLAKDENPQKTAEMTKKYAKPLEGTKPKSYGLTPTSTRETGAGKMSPREAGEKAFDEIMGNLVIQDTQLP